MKIQDPQMLKLHIISLISSVLTYEAGKMLGELKQEFDDRNINVFNCKTIPKDLEKDVQVYLKGIEETANDIIEMEKIFKHILLGKNDYESILNAIPEELYEVISKFIPESLQEYRTEYIPSPYYEQHSDLFFKYIGVNLLC